MKKQTQSLALPIVLIGTGPSALMAASILTDAGRAVVLLEKKKGPGRKFLIAGSSGLNVTYDAAPNRFHEHYGDSSEKMKPALEAFSATEWLEFIHRLGISTFKGTSRRYFVEGMKASKLLRAWVKRLHEHGAQFRYQIECTDFEVTPEGVRLHLSGQTVLECAAVCFCLGGASYEPTENPLRWPQIFLKKKIAMKPFEPANVGYEITWPSGFADWAQGKPLKNITLKTTKGSRRGDLILTRYGIEGTPVYTVGMVGEAHIDLKPDLDESQIIEKLSRSDKKISNLKKAKKYLNLTPAATKLIAALKPEAAQWGAAEFAKLVKNFSIDLQKPRPIDEAISSRGGVYFDELDEKLMLRRFPGVFVAGEMLDWDAPTGGFLIQGCVSQGALAGRGMLDFLKKRWT